MSDSLLPHSRHKLSAGRFYPLGATPKPGGVNFAVYSRHATDVFLLLFDEPTGPPTDVIRFAQKTRHVWHQFVHGLAPGQLYGLRVRGPFDPGQGHRFNEKKLLVDPYAKALTGLPRNEKNLLLAYDPASPEHDASVDTRDDAAVVPKAIVVDDAFDWQGDQHLDVPWEQLVIYEAHVKGMTAHPSSKVERPGTYLGLIEKIPHLVELGVTAIELLPVHAHYTEDFLLERGLTNYWGYNTLSFFAPETSYAAEGPHRAVAEFKTLVREMHKAGIEVILDVVYNHSAEGNELGPTLSLRGIDNASYYWLTGPDDAPARHYVNPTGCGNALDLSKPATLRLVLDSLRYWVEQMHVDGFRFDLASVLGREHGLFHDSSAFFDAVAQDPVIGRVKLIAEPWDLSTYQVGSFPVEWAEWNGRFRDTVRKFVKGDAGQVRDLGYRLTGSADLYGQGGRAPYHSVNFVTCHDGFTLRDLVSYDRKHNAANREDDRDGTDANDSWCCGVEGETDDAAIVLLRRQLAKNHVFLLLFSAGTPMMLGGDELFRTQRGNNNAYCQDNAISWIDWSEGRKHGEMRMFVKRAIAMRMRYPVLRRRAFYLGRDRDGNEVPDIAWFGPDGRTPHWDDPNLRFLAWQLDGLDAADEPGDYRLFFIANADAHPHDVPLPTPAEGTRWKRVIDTSLPPGDDFLDPGAEEVVDPQDRYLVAPRSSVALVAERIG